MGGSTSLGAVNVLSLVLLFLLAASALRSHRQMERLVSALIVGSVPVALYGWVQVLMWDPLDWSGGSLSPVHSTAGYSLYLGAYLAMVIPFTLVRTVSGSTTDSKRHSVYHFLAYDGTGGERVPRRGWKPARSEI